MSLERRLSDALHSVDRYQPSPDLFARTSLSIEEDRAHRRRLLVGAAAFVGLVAAACLLLGAVGLRLGDGTLAVPRWALLAVQLEFQISLLLALAPAIRRFGRPLLDDAFRLGPGLPERFSRLVDVAYYLFLGGVIVLSADVSALTFNYRLLFGLEDMAPRIGAFCAVMGLAHAVNLLAIPVAGLIHGSVARRARRAASDDPPEPSPAAVRADRVAGWLSWGLILPVMLGAALLIVAFLVGGIDF